MLTLRNELRAKASAEKLHDAATFAVTSKESMLEKAAAVVVLATQNEDVRSLQH